MYKRDMEARSPNHCCRGKARSITYSKCVSVAYNYPVRKAHAPYTVIGGLSGSTICFHIILQTTRFSVKRLLNTKCVFFSTTFV
jgi:competence transcription factor ComK